MRHSQRGFSLVELCIAIVLIGVLSALAVPSFLDATYKARRAEIAPNVAGIRLSELAYNASHDGFVATEEAPRTLSAGNGDKEQAEWDPSVESWRELGWKPDGAVRGTYEVTVDGNDICIMARENIDGDSAITTWYSADGRQLTSDDSLGCSAPAEGGSGSTGGEEGSGGGTESGSGGGTESGSGGGTESGSGGGTESGSGGGTESGSGGGTESGSGGGTESGSGGGTESGSGGGTESGSGTGSETGTESGSETGSESEEEDESGSKKAKKDKGRGKSSESSGKGKGLGR